jgi:hypothetical protein
VDRLVHARMLRADCCCFQNAGRRILHVLRVAGIIGCPPRHGNVAVGGEARSGGRRKIDVVRN